MHSSEKYLLRCIKILTLSVMVGLWSADGTHDCYAAPPTPESVFIQDSISACNEIRSAGPEGYETTLLPKKFEDHLRESLKKAKAILTQGGDVVINTSAPGAITQKVPKKRKVMIAEAQSLENDVEELIRDHKLTLKQWNLFHLRLVILFNQSLDHKEYLSIDSRLESAVSSQKTLNEYLLHHQPGFLRFDPYDSCVVSTFHDLGVDELNRAFVEGVYPYGVVSQFTHADGGFFSPWVFFNHDSVHMMDEVIYFTTEPPKLKEWDVMARKRKLGKEFLDNWLPKFTPSQQARLSFAYFLLHHEKLLLFKDPKARGSSYVGLPRRRSFSTDPTDPNYEAPPVDFSAVGSKHDWLNSTFCKLLPQGIGARISNCYDMGSLIPQEVINLLNGVPLPIFEGLLVQYMNYLPPKPILDFYFESTALFCREWAKLRWPDDEQLAP